jgi:transcription termination factor Rho
MPVMDGWGFLKEYNNVKGGSDIFVLSSTINPIEIRRAESNTHVSGFIERPLTIEKLDSITSILS